MVRPARRGDRAGETRGMLLTSSATWEGWRDSSAARSSTRPSPLLTPACVTTRPARPSFAAAIRARATWREWAALYRGEAEENLRALRSALLTD